MGYERDDSTRWGNWPNTSMVQAVKSMGARHNVREPYISFQRASHKIVYICVCICVCVYLLFFALILTLTLCFTKPMLMRRTKWSAPHPSCGTLSITTTIYLMVLEIWLNMSCGCPPSNVSLKMKYWKLVFMYNMHFKMVTYPEL